MDICSFAFFYTQNPEYEGEIGSGASICNGTARARIRFGE